MTKDQTIKSIYIIESQLKQLNHEKAREFYLNIFNEVLTPLLNLENKLLNDDFSENFLEEDFYEITREALREVKLIKIDKYKEIKLNEFLEMQEQKLEDKKVC